jgi:hypothetical protein
MAEPPRKALFPNPFYVLLLVASTVFTVTVLAYLVSPNLARHALAQRAAGRPGPAPGSIRLADWIDRTGPTLLAVEFAVMFISGILAMATDRWFPSKSTRPRPPAAETRDTRPADPR